MNLQTHIKPELWLAISNSYEAGSYRYAVLDAFQYLSDVLREKSGVDGDGVNLVGQALGGSAPKVRVNKLQTQTERDVQKGLEQTLRGLYLAIRNPRSHEQVEDTKDTADAIIYFVDYLLGILAKSEEPFTIPKFLDRVLDPYFVGSEQYAQLLAAEIPAKKRTDTLIEIYRRKLEGDGNKLKYAVGAILAKLSSDEMADFLAVVSEELRTTQNEKDIIRTLQILSPTYWFSINEAAKLRIENQLIESIRVGEAYPGVDKLKAGGLGTWARDFLGYFTLCEEVKETLLRRLEAGPASRLYVVEYFRSVLPDLFLDKCEIQRCVKAISEAVRRGEVAVRRELVRWLPRLPEEWQKEFAEELRDITDPDHPETFLFDGTPFLSSPQAEEEIPF